jgi:hypothetical protein
MGVTDVLLLAFVCEEVREYIQGIGETIVYRLISRLIPPFGSVRRLVSIE